MHKTHNLPIHNDLLILQNDFNIDVLTVGPSGPGGPSINMPCENENNERVMVRVMVDNILYQSILGHHKHLHTLLHLGTIESNHWHVLGEWDETGDTKRRSPYKYREKVQ